MNSNMNLQELQQLRVSVMKVVAEIDKKIDEFKHPSGRHEFTRKELEELGWEHTVNSDKYITGELFKKGDKMILLKYENGGFLMAYRHQEIGVIIDNLEQLSNYEKLK